MKSLNLNYLRTFTMLAVMLLTAATAWADGVTTVNVSYKDAGGTTKNVVATVLDNSMNDLAAGWYVVNSDVTYGDAVLYTNGDGDVNIILCDGATLTASGLTSRYNNSDRLIIYGQSQGTGTANISGTLDGNRSLTINGGIINANRLDSGQGNVSIYGGTVNVETIVPHSGVFLYGGNVIVTDKINAKGSGGTISLCGATVKAGSYSADGYVCISKRLTYYDGTGASYTGTEEYYTGYLNLTKDEIAAIAGKTLRTFNYGSCGVQTVNDGNDVTWMMSDGDNNGSYETLIISGSGAMADFSSVDNQPWKASRADIKKVKIEPYVTGIGNNAFNGCSYLKTVYVMRYDTDSENTITTLGTNVFEGCHSNLTIYVSSAALGAYKEAENWFGYESKIKGSSVSVKIDPNEAPFDFVTLDEALENARDAYKPAQDEYPAVVPTVTLNTDTNLDDTFVTIGDGENDLALILDLNGHKITSTNSYIKIDEETYISGYTILANCKLTITDSAEGGGGAIENTNADPENNWGRPALKVGSTGDVTISGGNISGCYGIENKNGGTLTVTGGTISGTNGVGIYNIGVTNEQNEVTAISTLTVTGGTISGTDYGIANHNGAKLTVTGGTIESTGNHAIDNLNSSTLTIGSGVTLKYPGGYGINNSSDSKLTLTGIPTFVYTGEGNGVDINLGDVITFADNFTYTKPNQPIKMIGMDKGKIFTSGYGTNCVYPEGHAKAGQTVDPNELFIDGNNDEGEYAELDATSGEVRFNTPFNVTLALVDPTKNVNQTDILYCGTLKSAIDKVAEITALAKEAGVELTSAIIQPQKDYQISDADKTNSTVEFGNDENAIVATLDLNGHTITGTASEYLITVAENSTLTVAGDGSIAGDMYYLYGLIDNNGTLNITGGNYNNFFTNNGAMTVSGGTFTAYGGNVSIHSFGGGSLTVSGGTFNVNGGGCAIQNWADLTLSALPTFAHAEGATNCIDINLDKDAVITFDKAITTFPTTPIVVKVKNAAPYVLTSGYGTYVKDGDDNVIDPALMFAVTADNSLLDNAVLGIHASEAALFVTETVSFPVGKSTYYDNKGLKLVEDNDKLKFYTVTNAVDDVAQVTEITGKTFGKETPLIVSNESSAAIDAVMVEAFDDAEDADFAASCADDLGEKSVFSGFKGTAVAIDEIGFNNYKAYFGFTGHDFVKISKDGRVLAHRCWLEMGGSSNNAPRLSIVWDGDTTGVKSLTPTLSEGEGVWYTLDGRKLNGKPTAKGIYIYNGNKRVVK